MRRATTGALFIDYLLSEEGQKVIVTTSGCPPLLRVKSPEASYSKPRRAHTRYFDIGKGYRAIGSRYREIFGGARELGSKPFNSSKVQAFPID
jgi:hypothetical protein